MDTVPVAKALFLNEYQVARALNVKVQTLRRWRSQKVGPPFVRLGNSPRYSPTELQEWVKDLPRWATAKMPTDSTEVTV